jgi:demethylmenaquinone methyltransferase / 2-methoxy-6-polyprenyl-1,4-benzoquinol methylase
MSESVTPYKSDSSKKEQVKTMFNNIAGRYDFLNRVLSLRIDVYWRNRAIKQLKKYQPDTILDVACGTGDFTIAALKTGASKVTGVDISVQMLEAGIKKIKHKKLDNRIELLEGDSENLTFGNNTFDACTVAFGVRNFEHLQKGLDEIYRVLKPGAPIVVLEFSKPKSFPFKQLYNFYFSTILPAIGRLISGDSRAYTYLFESVSAFPEGDAFLKFLTTAGFKNGTCTRLSLGICSLYIAEK